MNNNSKIIIIVEFNCYDKILNYLATRLLNLNFIFSYFVDKSLNFKNFNTSSFVVQIATKTAFESSTHIIIHH